jgi:hypothetical protein
MENATPNPIETPSGDGSSQSETLRPLHTRGMIKGRLHLLAAVMAALVLVVFVAPDASATHKRRGAKTSLVSNSFGVPDAPTPPAPPPAEILCEWFHEPPREVISYVCFGTGYARQLTTPDPDDDQDLLVKGDNPPDYAVAEVARFSCTKSGQITEPISPDDYTCRYRHRHHHQGSHVHTFRMDEMVIMTDPDPAVVPDDPNPVEYALPPHK